ncbi:PHD finger protein 10 [Geranomyces michiganensis]|nr:PHD finger protein 10 [Geranomyces michiganensis]
MSDTGETSLAASENDEVSSQAPETPAKSGLKRKVNGAGSHENTKASPMESPPKRTRTDADSAKGAGTPRRQKASEASASEVDAQDASGSEVGTPRRGRRRSLGDEMDLDTQEISADEDGDDSASNVNETKESIDEQADATTDKKLQDKRVSALAQPASTPASRPRGRPPSSAKSVGVSAGVETVEEEDIETEWDEKGELKINKDGDLLGGREYKCRVFGLPRHPGRKYMLTVDIAKTLQYRDTYIFFLRNSHITRVKGSEEDKAYLEEQGILPGQLRRRPVSVATARSIFRSFGHRIVKRGRPVRDDYWVGDQEEPPDDPDRDDDYDEGVLTRRSRLELARNSTRSEGPARRTFNSYSQEEKELLFPFTIGPRVTLPATLNGDDDLYKRATSAADFNRRLAMQRPRTFYDRHTNIEQIPSITQPLAITVQYKKGTLQAPGAETVICTPSLSPAGASGTDTSDEVWINLDDPGKDELYPVGILRGQYQGMYSIYQTRFSAADTAEPVFSTFGGDQANAETPAPTFRASSHGGLVGESPAVPIVTNPSTPSVNNGMTRAIQHDANGNAVLMSSRIKHMEHACGEITRSGLGCKRPVYNAGEKCLYHAKPATAAVDPTLCVHCHSFRPPPPAPGTPASGKPPPALPTTVLSCAVCQTNHHPSCIDFDDAVLICKAQTYPWQCSTCKLCTTCETAGDETKLLFCDTCDRGYHTDCLVPPLAETPAGTWLCPRCKICASCGNTSSEHWQHAILPSSKNVGGAATSPYGTYLCTYCPSCYEHYQRKMFCPVCMGVYKEDEDSPMVCCDSCDRWVHKDCDPDLTAERYERLTEAEDEKYTCLLCSEEKLERVIGRLNHKADVAEGVVSVVSGNGRQRWTVVLDKGKKLVVPPIGRANAG